MSRVLSVGLTPLQAVAIFLAGFAGLPALVAAPVILEVLFA